MKKQLLNGAIAAVLGATAALSAMPAMAYQAGDMVLRGGLAGVLPTGDGAVPGVPGGKVEADDGFSAGITFTYMATNNIGIGVLGAWPFSHDVDGTGALAGLGTVAEIEHLPPTLTLQYHFDTASKLRPYVGAGINYTTVIDIDETPSMAGDQLDLDDSWGFALEAGVDYELQNDWLVGAAVWYLDIAFDTTISGGNLGLANPTFFETEVDPWVFMLSVGKKF